MSDRTLDLSTLKLEVGDHVPDHTFCVMEAVAYIAGEPWSDRPKCASPVVTNMGIRLNDRMSQRVRDLMVPLIPKIVGTANDGKDARRGFIAADWAVRVIVPLALEARGKKKEARQLRALKPIVDAETARAAANAAANAANAAANAANAAANAAYAANAANAAANAAYAAANAANAAANGDIRREVEDAAVAMFAAVIEGKEP